MVREVLLLLFDDLGQLLLDVGLNVLDQELRHIHFLVHNGHTTFIQVADRDKGGKQDFLELLVHEIREGQIAQLLKDGVLAAVECLLVGLIQEAKVSDEDESFVQELLDVVVLVDVAVVVAVSSSSPSSSSSSACSLSSVT